MRNTGIKIFEICTNAVLNDKKSASYNPAIWRNSVTRYADMGAQFYTTGGATPNYYVKYSADGLTFFKEFYPFIKVLSGYGFTRVVIINGEICENGFGADGNGRIPNNDDGRKWLRDNVCACGVMISNESL